MGGKSSPSRTAAMRARSESSPFTARRTKPSANQSADLAKRTTRGLSDDVPRGRPESAHSFSSGGNRAMRISMARLLRTWDQCSSPAASSQPYSDWSSPLAMLSEIGNPAQWMRMVRCLFRCRGPRPFWRVLHAEISELVCNDADDPMDEVVIASRPAEEGAQRFSLNLHLQRHPTNRTTRGHRLTTERKRPERQLRLYVNDATRSWRERDQRLSPGDAVRRFGQRRFPPLEKPLKRSWAAGAREAPVSAPGISRKPSPRRVVYPIRPPAPCARSRWTQTRESRWGHHV